jgi:penicillin-binding protein 2
MASGISSSFPNKSSPKTSLVKSIANREALFWRAAFFMFGITTFMGICAYRLVELQVITGRYYQHLAEQNRVRPIPLPAERGAIVDRNGKLLASNQLSRGVYLWPRQQSPEQWHRSATQLSQILGMPAEEILDRLNKAGYNTPLPILISQQISPTAFVALAEQASQLPGVEIFAGSTRFYPQKDLAAHVLGYIGEASEADMKAHPDYPNGMIVGQMGIERLANADLEGRWGERLVEVNAGGQETRLLGIKPAKPGSTVRLTLDLDLQQAAERGLAGRRGAVVVLDVNTGDVLALASAPTFDPDVFTRRVTQAEWQRFQEGDQPFLNRALQGYPPGSTFKIVTATAGMQSGNFLPDSTLMTYPSISLGGIQFWEHTKHGYGVIGFRDAFAFSSNTFFYQVGLSTGPEQIAKWGKILGISSTDVGLEGEGHGIIPTPDQKQALYGEPWYGGDTVSMAIGQGVVQATPLEMAVVVSTIANGGWRVHPYLLANQTGSSAVQRVKTDIAPETIAAIRSGLIAAVQYGTAQSLNDGSIPQTAGKTGTAEVIGREPHAWFVGYGPVNNPKIAVAVIVENGGYGAAAAVPIAHEIYKTYFSRPNTGH